jgi:hypothetical protein
MQPPMGRGIDEHKGEQLADGTVLDVARVPGGPHRVLSTAPSPAGPWSAPVPSPALTDPGCNGDVIRVDADPASPRAHWLLASHVVDQRGRSDLVVQLSTDDGRTWRSYLTVLAGPAGYSTMVRLPDGSFGILFEDSRGGELGYAHFALSQVLATGPVKQAYLDRGGSAGPLGAETGLPVCGLAQAGCFQTFQNGTVYWSPGTGAHVVRGGIAARWAAGGWERGPQGYPVTDETCGLAQGGCFQTFQNGATYWSPGTGAHVVQGAILARWAAGGWERSPQGYPVTDEVCGLPHGGCSQGFQRGTITASATGTRVA